jgi:hypothetical protein
LTARTITSRDAAWDGDRISAWTPGVEDVGRLLAAKCQLKLAKIAFESTRKRTEEIARMWLAWWPKKLLVVVTAVN